MTSNDKLRPYLFAFLAFCVLSSKHIIIYNEELLVAISFLAFVVFTFNYFGDTVKESLDERRIGVKSELERFFLLKKESLKELALEHEKVSSLRKGLVSLKTFTRGEAEAGAKRSIESLKETLSQQIRQRLAQLSFSNLPLQTKWQNRVAYSQLGMVLANLEKKSKEGGQGISWDPRIIEKALHLLKEKAS
ncbi:probable ATP synthase protein MI25 at N-terminal half (mitochondrion) [Coccomyxa sp. Obi]|nr:probable ATP synthase protein MI25 at N-terminal half [Coccomyxa sp. Obi]